MQYNMHMMDYWFYIMARLAYHGVSFKIAKTKAVRAGQDCGYLN